MFASRSQWLAVGLTFAGVLLLPHEALAHECATNAECPKGFLCAGTAVVADGGPVSTCAGGQCQTDSDCGAGFRCLFGLGTICTNGGQDCQPNNVCVPQWEVPCTDDAQCGPGFTCTTDGGSPAPNPAATIVSGGVFDCGPDRFDASFPSYDMERWVRCEDIPLPPFESLCDGGNGDALPPCFSLCTPGSMCLSITSYACSGPASGQSCQSAADCPGSWTCACPLTCSTGVIRLPDAGHPVPDTSCATVCTPPNVDLSPDYGECGGAVTAGPANAGTDAEAPPAPATGDASPSSGATTSSGDSSHGGCQSAPGPASGGTGGLVALVAGALAQARRKRATPSSAGPAMLGPPRRAAPVAPPDDPTCRRL